MALKGEVRAGFHVRDLTIGHVLRTRAQSHGDKVFMNYLPDGRQFTYREVDELANRIANGLLARGFGKGSHVGILMDNSPEQFFLYCGLARIGAVIIPINTAMKGDILHYYLDQSDSTALIVDADLADRFSAVADRLPRIANIVVFGGADSSNPLHATGRSLIAYEELTAASAAAPEIDVAFSDMAFILYTSGTTGPSKGCMFTHARCLTGAAGHLETHKYTSDDVFYVTLPMFHSNAMQGSLFVALLAGASVAIRKRFSVSTFWDDIAKSGATTTNLLGSMVNFLWNAPPSAADAEHRFLRCGCVPVPPFAVEFQKRFNCRFAGGYGLSDYGVPIVFTVEDPEEKFGSAGRVVDGWDVRIVDDQEFDVPVGTPGEILIRSNMVWNTTLGYYKKPEATMEAWKNFWFHTGDRAYFDADGYLWFVDRKKDSIRRRGENVSAFEVEKVFVGHPAIKDAAAFPVSVSQGTDEEIGVALILKDDASIDETALIAHCQANMSYFMVPRFLTFVEDFPRTLTQKIEKYKLRAAVEADLNAIWDRERAGVKISR